MKTPLDQQVETTPLLGGPLGLALNRLNHLALLSSVASRQVECAVRLVLPDGADDLVGEWDKTRLAHEQHSRGLTFSGLVSIHDTDSFHRLGVALANVGPPDGTRLEMAAFSDSRPSARPRFAGTLTGGLLLVEASHPKLTSEILSAALEIIRQSEECQAIVLETAEIAENVFAATEQDLSLPPHCFELNGCQLQLRDDRLQMFLSRALLYALLHTPRFLQAWSLQECLAEQEEGMAELARQMAALKVKFRSPTPQAGELILEGRMGPIHSADMTTFPHVLEEDVRDADEELSALGFEPLGTMAGAEIGVHIRGYACAEKDAYALVKVDRMDRFFLELHSRLESGLVLITTGMQTGHSCAGVTLCQSAPMDSWQELLERHRTRLRDHPDLVQPTGDLRTLAASLDDLAHALRG